MLEDSYSKRCCLSSVLTIAEFKITESNPYYHFLTSIFHIFLSIEKEQENEGF